VTIYHQTLKYLYWLSVVTKVFTLTVPVQRLGKRRGRR